MERKFEMSASLRDSLIAYLEGRPLKEVYEGWVALKQLKMIEESPSADQVPESPPKKKREVK